MVRRKYWLKKATKPEDKDKEKKDEEKKKEEEKK